MVSDTVILAIIGLGAAAIAGIPSTIVAFASYKQAIINGTKTDRVEAKANEIHTLTNSNLSLVQKNLEVALAKIEGLNKLVASLVGAKNIADALAAGAGHPGPESAIDEHSTAVVESLAKIDTNTKAIAENTSTPIAVAVKTVEGKKGKL